MSKKAHFNHVDTYTQEMTLQRILNAKHDGLPAFHFAFLVFAVSQTEADPLVSVSDQTQQGQRAKIKTFYKHFL